MDNSSILNPVLTSPTVPKPIVDPISAAQLAVMFGSKSPTLIPADIAAKFVGSNPLAGVETVEGSLEAIKEIQQFSATTGKEVRYPRDLLRVQHIVAFELVNPFCTTAEVCRFFSITPGTYKTITASDAYRQLMESHGMQLLRQAPQELVDKMKDTVEMAVDNVQKALLASSDGEFALAAADKLANRLGMGVKHNTNVQINNNVVTAEMIAAARNKRALRNAPVTLEGTAVASGA